MHDRTDAALLAEFARNQSEAAFAELVRRHLNLVHSVALRHTDNPQHAQEITQAVFIIFARKATSLGRNVVVSGWLYHTARLTAANFRRAEFRRIHREQEAYMQSTLAGTTPDTIWHELAPRLDEAMARLGASDRDAVVLRYFENKTLQEVGVALGLEERTAQKRVARALEKLRKIFSKRGVTLSATLIASALGANSVQAAPAGLAATISATTVKGTVVTASITALVKGTMKIMTWMKIKFALSIGTAVLLTGGAVALALPKEEAAAKATAIAAKLTAKPATPPPVVAPAPQPNPSRPAYPATAADNLSATNILTTVQQTYASLSTYRDSGRTIHGYGDAVWTNTFSLRLGRTNQYLVEVAEQHPRSYTNRFNYWSTGDDNFSSHIMHMGHLTPNESARKAPDMTSNLSITTGDTIMPTVFFHLSWGNYLTYLNGLWRKSVSRQPDEKIGDVDCYVVAQTDASQQITLWVGKEDFLIRCFRRFSTREASLEARKQSPIQSQSPAENVRDQTIIEIHENIVVNEEMKPEDFIHEVATHPPEGAKRP